VWHERNGSAGLATDFLDRFGERLARNPRDDESVIERANRRPMRPRIRVGRTDLPLRCGAATVLSLLTFSCAPVA
jgi:hypothetical protein